MTSSFSITRFAGGLLRIGTGLFAAGLAAGLGLILHYFYVTPFEICSAAFSTMTVSEVWPWAPPLLATEGLALGLGALGLALLASNRPHAIAAANPALPTDEG